MLLALAPSLVVAVGQVLRNGLAVLHGGCGAAALRLDRDRPAPEPGGRAAGPEGAENDGDHAAGRRVTKVEVKVLSTIWLGRSRRKFRSNLGENWVDDSWSATTVSPRTSAITVMTELVMLLSRVRASGPLAPWIVGLTPQHPGRRDSLFLRDTEAPSH